jgi:hypothetical protein
MARSFAAGLTLWQVEVLKILTSTQMMFRLGGHSKTMSSMIWLGGCASFLFASKATRTSPVKDSGLV